MPHYKKLHVVTRGSNLALVQTNHVIDLCAQKFPSIKIQKTILKTDGDRFQKRPLGAFRETGIFVKELENALLQKEADFAVHSLKDAPTKRLENLVLVAYLPREDVRDVLIINDPEKIKSSPLKIGSGSLRRRLQLQSEYPHWNFLEIRGNVETRLRKVLSGEYDGTIMAKAGLNRLNSSLKKDSKIWGLLQKAIVLEVSQMLPAPGQGCVAIECRADEPDVGSMLGALNDFQTERCVRTERLFLAQMEGGCKTPIAALATLLGDRLSLEGFVADPRTGKFLREKTSGPESDFEKIAGALASDMEKKAREQKIEYRIER